MPAVRLKRLARRLLIATISAALALVLAEQVYRVSVLGAAAFSPRKLASLHLFGESGLLRVAEFPGLRYQLKPDLDTLYLLQPFRTNSIGLRDEEYPREKPADTFRVAVVGDSFTMGSGVAIQDAWHSRLEELLDAAPGGRRYECVNYGVAGYGLEDYTATVTTLVHAYQPDLVLLALTRTDRMPAGLNRGPFEPRPPRNGALRPFLYEAVQKALGRALSSAPKDEEAEDPGNVAPGDDPDTPLGEFTQRYLRRWMEKLARSARRQELPLAVVHLHAAVAARGGESRVGEAYRLLCAELELPYYDASLQFAGTDPASFHIFPWDAHPNAAGHAIFARGIHGWLVESGLVPR